MTRVFGALTQKTEVGAFSCIITETHFIGLFLFVNLKIVVDDYSVSERKILIILS